ncbi:MAG: hypothetical protein ACK5DG_12825 [Chitinophagaceae bacterium]
MSSSEFKVNSFNRSVNHYHLEYQRMAVIALYNHSIFPLKFIRYA